MKNERHRFDSAKENVEKIVESDPPLSEEGKRIFASMLPMSRIQSIAEFLNVAASMRKRTSLTTPTLTKLKKRKKISEIGEAEN
jgi:hypothetical protein